MKKFTAMINEVAIKSVKVDVLILLYHGYLCFYFGLGISLSLRVLHYPIVTSFRS